MIFRAPQIIFVVLLAIRLGAAIVKHGQPRPLFNMWWKMIHVGITVWLLYAGGFFGTMR